MKTANNRFTVRGPRLGTMEVEIHKTIDLYAQHTEPDVQFLSALMRSNAGLDDSLNLAREVHSATFRKRRTNGRYSRAHINGLHINGAIYIENSHFRRLEVAARRTVEQSQAVPGLLKTALRRFADGTTYVSEAQSLLIGLHERGHALLNAKPVDGADWWQLLDGPATAKWGTVLEEGKAELYARLAFRKSITESGLERAHPGLARAPWIVPSTYDVIVDALDMVLTGAAKLARVDASELADRFVGHDRMDALPWLAYQVLEPYGLMERPAAERQAIVRNLVRDRIAPSFLAMYPPLVTQDAFFGDAYPEEVATKTMLALRDCAASLNPKLLPRTARNWSANSSFPQQLRRSRYNTIFNIEYVDLTHEMPSSENYELRLTPLVQGV